MIEKFSAGSSSLRDLDADIEQELREALGGLSDKDIYGDFKTQQRRPAPSAQSGDKKGKVVAIRGADVFVEVPGGRTQGLLPAAQFPEGVPPIGAEVDVKIEGYDGANGLLLLSRKGGAIHADWSSVAVGMTVEVRVTGVNTGGLSGEVNGIRAFMPISQVDIFRVEHLDQYLNQRLLCMVSEVNQQEHTLIVSRRDYLEREREEKRERLWQELAEGQVREGVVRSVRDFGAFVDLGGVDGLLHVSEMGWSRVNKAADIVQPGQTIKVVVLRIDRERRKLSLGLRQLTPSPWDGIELRYPPGAIVKGKVTRLMEYGAFVELEPAVEGLVHLSELAPQRVRRVKDVVQEEQEVQVAVMRVDPPARKISLSIKAAASKVIEEPQVKTEEETVVEARPPRPRTIPLRGGLNKQF